MTRKHFNKLAYELAMVEPQREGSEEWKAWERSCYAVSKVCWEENGNFDRPRFLEACRYDYWKSHKAPR